MWPLAAGRLRQSIEVRRHRLNYFFCELKKQNQGPKSSRKFETTLVTPHFRTHRKLPVGEFVMQIVYHALSSCCFVFIFFKWKPNLTSYRKGSLSNVEGERKKSLGKKTFHTKKFVNKFTLRMVNFHLVKAIETEISEWSEIERGKRQLSFNI